MKRFLIASIIYIVVGFSFFLITYLLQLFENVPPILWYSIGWLAAAIYVNINIREEKDKKKTEDRQEDKTKEE